MSGVFNSRGLQIAHNEYGVKDGDSPNEQFDMTSATATRILDVAWANRGIAAYQLLGYAVWNPINPSAPVIQRYLPDFHPDFPWMVATKITNIKGIGARGWTTANGVKIARYQIARITVQYEFPEYDLLYDDYTTSEFDRYRTFEAKPAAEYLSVPLGSGRPYLTWSQGPGSLTNPKRPFPGNVGFIVGTIDFHWKWLQVPFEALPFDDILGTIGRVNKTEFADCPAGTLLLIGVDYKRNNSPYGLRTWTIEYTARYNPRLHNNFYDFIGDAATGTGKGWYQASTDGTYHAPGSVTDGKLLFDEREFDDLFTPPPP